MGCVCSLSFVSAVISVSSPLCCVRVLVIHLGEYVRSTSLVSSLAVSVTGARTCLVIVAWHCVGNCHLLM